MVIDTDSPLLPQDSDQAVNRKPLLHRQVGAVFLKNLLLQIRHPVRLLIMFILIPALVSVGHTYATRYDEPHDNPVVLDPLETKIVFDHWASTTKELYWGTQLTSPHLAEIGNIGPLAKDNTGVFSYSDWICGSYSHEDCPPDKHVIPPTININGKHDFELSLYKMFRHNDSYVRYSFFIDEFSSNKVALHSYLNASDYFELSPGNTYILYDRLDWLATSNFFLTGLRRSINEKRSKIPSMDSTIIPVIQAFPYSSDMDFFVASQVSSLLLVGLLVLPLIYLPFITEKKAKILTLCRVLGMSEQSMILGSMVTGALFCLFICSVLIIPGKFTSVRLFSKNSLILFIILTSVHGSSLAAIASLLAPLTPSSNIGVVVSLLAVNIFGISASIAGFNTAGFNWNFFFYPPYPIYHSYLVLGHNSCWDCSGVSLKGLPMFLPHILSSLFNAVLFSVIALFLSNLFSGSKVQLPFREFFNKIKFSKEESKPLLDHENTIISNTSDCGSDVAKERRLALSHTKDLSIRAVDVFKVYNPNSVDRVEAVKNVSMAVSKGTCRVLLGVNGSGKTTLMSVLIGQLAPTSFETISLNNVEIYENIQKARFSMGFVPQHSVFWTELTVADHLRFFASLKLPWKEVGNAVEESLRSVGLKHAQSKKLSTLSGGQKRRASIAFALIGRPQLVVADELTTGISLDISQQIWEIIKKSKKEGVTLLVSTHFMQEATAISDSISIQKAGEILCVDSVENLQMRFGEGYRLFVSAVPKYIERVKIIITEIENSQHFSTVNNVLHFQLPREISLSSLFKELNILKSEGQVIDFGVQSATLEDVFLSLNN
ncbi:hypothetical protein GEMRC1_010813 [Eukaryota sp. GEM-RC1]